MRPIYAPSAEAVEEQNSKNKARDAAAAEKPVVKLPVPPFRYDMCLFCFFHMYYSHII